MTKHFTGVSFCAFVALVAVAEGAGAQTPSPSPAPSVTPLAFSAHGHVGVTVTAQGTTFSAIAQLAVAQRANLTRVDLLSLRSDTTTVPPINVTVVIDRSANTLTEWSDATKRYYVQSFLPSPAVSPSPKASPAPRGSTTPRPFHIPGSPFANLDLLEATLKLIGHTMTAGIPTTGLAFDLQIRKKGETALTHVSATAQTADEFAAFPMMLDASIDPAAAQFSAKISYAVDDVARATPAITRFKLPAGYTHAPSLIGVVFPAPR